MTPSDPTLWTEDEPAAIAESSKKGGSERRRTDPRAKGRKRLTGRTVRLFYFTLASIWGFLVGAAGLVVLLGLAGVPVDAGRSALVGLAPLSLLAVLGGWLSAAAYRQARRRRSRGG